MRTEKPHPSITHQRKPIARPLPAPHPTPTRGRTTAHAAQPLGEASRCFTPSEITMLPMIRLSFGSMPEIRKRICAKSQLHGLRLDHIRCLMAGLSLSHLSSEIITAPSSCQLHQPEERHHILMVTKRLPNLQPLHCCSRQEKEQKGKAKGACQLNLPLFYQ